MNFLTQHTSTTNLASHKKKKNKNRNNKNPHHLQQINPSKSQQHYQENKRVFFVSNFISLVSSLVCVFFYISEKTMQEQI